MKPTKLLAILSGPVSALLGYFVMYHVVGADPTVSRMMGVALWMACWWILEAVPLAVTSLLPIFLFPLGKIMGTKEVAPMYMNHVLFLFVGGFIMAFAMEKWNLHKRIALRIILWIGTDVTRILLGLMLASYILSMWISNTATTMMMIPTTLAVIVKVEQMLGGQKSRIGIGMLLGIAYAASIGGTATLVGTPPNLIFLTHYTATFPEGAPISFLQWFSFGFPISLTFLFIAYWVIRKMYAPKQAAIGKTNVALFQQEYDTLGRPTFEEKVVMVLFTVMAILWFTRADLEIGSFTLPGWSNFFFSDYADYFQDGTVAIFIATLLFIIPSKQHRGEMVMEWESVKKLPYNIILLFGGGFALAKGFTESGLSDWLAGQLDFVGTLPAIITIFVICTFMTFLTEMTSNMATTQLVLPVFAAIAVAADIDPLLLMIPATFSASFAFMLPVATAPNTIIFGSEKVAMKDMIRTGIILNLIGVVLITMGILVLGKLVFNI